DACPAGALFEEIFEHESRWYALRAVTLDDYRSAMRPRSARWRTVCLPADRFDAVSVPFADLAPSRAASGNRREPGPGEPSGPLRTRAAALASARGAEYRRSP
ncbi:MAG: hypothetical protein ACF8QF_10135, partial [Phycisphaerales bacterium]